MTGCDEGFEEGMLERMDDLVLQLKRIASSLEAIQQTVSPETLEVGKRQKSERRERENEQEHTYKDAKELISTIQEKAPTLHENMNNTKRFKSGDFLVKIDYVSKDTFKKIAREAEEIGGEYSKKWRGFIFKMGE